MSAPSAPGIVELGDLCDRQYALATGWFRTLGAWVRDETRPGRQRLWATAAHRHAWHAELWADRRPVIPPLAERPTPEAPAIDMAGGGDDGRDARYADALAELRTELGGIRERLDADLDPSTVRVVDLVDADLADLVTRLADGR